VHTDGHETNNSASDDQLRVHVHENSHAYRAQLIYRVGVAPVHGSDLPSFDEQFLDASTNVDKALRSLAQFGTGIYLCFKSRILGPQYVQG
jgi:hypothetical protein